MPEQGQFSREIEIKNAAEQEVLAVEEETEETEETAEEESQAQEIEEKSDFIDQENEANQLAAIREEEEFSLQQQANQILQEGLAFGSPSVVKWGIILLLAIANDVVDLLGLTGFGELLAWIISMGLTVSILLIMWLTDFQVKRANQFLADHGQPQIANPGRTKLVRELGRKVSQGPSSLTSKRHEVENKLNSFFNSKNIHGVNSLKALKNPIVTAFMGGGVESVPFLGDINLITIWVLISYFEEARGYRRVRQVTQEVYSQTSSQIA